MHILFRYHKHNTECTNNTNIGYDIETNLTLLIFTAKFLNAIIKICERSFAIHVFNILRILFYL